MNLSKRQFGCALLLGCLCSMSVFAKSSVEQNGDRLAIALPLLTLGGSLWVEQDTEGAWQLAKSVLSAKLSAEALKHLTNAPRPNGECCDSFPSGHSAIAFSTAAYIHYRYGWRYAVPAAIAASYVGYSRVDANAHYSRDVLAGAALGIASSYYFSTRYQGFSVTPYSDHGDLGLQLQGSF